MFPYSIFICNNIVSIFIPGLGWNQRTGLARFEVPLCKVADGCALWNSGAGEKIQAHADSLIASCCGRS